MYTHHRPVLKTAVYARIEGEDFHPGQLMFFRACAACTCWSRSTLLRMGYRMVFLLINDLQTHDNKVVSPNRDTRAHLDRNFGSELRVFNG